MNQEPSVKPTSQSVPSGSFDRVGATTRDVTDQAKEAAGPVVNQAKETAGQVAEQAKQQATSQLESQKERTVETLATVAHALHQTGQHLNEAERTAVGGYVEQAAERVETLTNYLRTRDVPSLLAETQEFARRNPGMFLGGAVVLGFIGARFLKSSGERAILQRYASAGHSPGSGYPAPGSSLTRAPYSGSGMPAVRTSGYHANETHEPTRTWEPGVSSTLEP